MRKQWSAFGFHDIKNLISTYFQHTYVRFSNNKYSTNWQKLNIGIMMGCVISPQLFVLVMEMILYNANVNTNQITSPSMKAFMDDVTNCRIQITYGTTGDPPPRAFQMGCYDNKAFKVPKFIIAERKLQRNKVFCQWKQNPNYLQKKVLRVSVAATPYHLLIDIVGRT